MGMYIALVHWTEQGIKDYKSTFDRADSVSQLAERLGGSQMALYWTVGPYDLVSISEFPDDETAAAFALAVGSQGNVRTTSMRAFTADEMRGVVGKLE